MQRGMFVDFVPDFLHHGWPCGDDGHITKSRSDGRPDDSNRSNAKTSHMGETIDRSVKLTIHVQYHYFGIPNPPTR